MHHPVLALLGHRKQIFLLVLPPRGTLRHSFRDSSAEPTSVSIRARRGVTASLPHRDSEELSLDDPIKAPPDFIADSGLHFEF